MTNARNGRVAALGFAVLVLSAGCAASPGAAPPPEALTLRELLAMDPLAVAAMEGAARSYWRHVIDATLDVQAEEEPGVRAANLSVVAAAPGVAMALPGPLRLALGVDTERAGKGMEPLLASEVATDGALVPIAATSLFEAGEDPLAPLRAAIGAGAARTIGAAGHAPGAAPGDAGANGPPLLEAPAAPFALLHAPGDDAAWYNPVLLALTDDGAARLRAAAAAAAATRRSPGAGTSTGRVGPTSYWGDRNPYRFYDSLPECAAAEETRCLGCMSGAAEECTAKLGGPSGMDECSVLAATTDGWMLACLMYAFSMATVEFCMDDAEPACVPAGLPYGIESLEIYRPTLDDAVCFAAVADCVTPYRASLGCGSPCGNCGEACGDCAGSLDACSASIAACNETCTGCGDSTSSTASSCASACESCAQISNDCNETCAVVRPLPPAPLDPARAPAALPWPWGALRNAAALLVPPLALLLWRRRLPLRRPPPTRTAEPAPAADTAEKEVAP